MIKEAEIVIDNFRNKNIKYITDTGYINNVFWNYEYSEWRSTLKIRDIFIRKITFSNYKDMLRQIVLNENGKIYFNG